ncbi:hypothetical protein [Magnetococcus marinus]|uniref:hypothetical protein n=1 Tax=Magnetococcus marinus TaxID=1124597 RepID=UPI00135F1089|nr:hypothetical protein [Magnetococcus marinus]
MAAALLILMFAMVPTVATVDSAMNPVDSDKKVVEQSIEQLPSAAAQSLKNGKQS